MYELMLALKKLKGSPNPITPMPKPPYDCLGYSKTMCLSEDGQSFYLMGGTNEASQPTWANYRFDFATETWTRLANIPATVTAPGFGGAAQIGDILYYFNRRQIFTYTISTDTWLLIANIANAAPGNIYGSPVWVYNGKLYRVGYSQGDYPSGTRLVEYDPATGVTTPKAVYTTALNTYTGGTLIGNKLYLMSGPEYSAGQFAIYDMDTFGRVIKDYPADSKMGWVVSCMEYGGLVYQLASDQKIPYSYNPVTEQFTPLGPLKTPLSVSHQAVAANDKIYSITATEFYTYGIANDIG